MRLTVEDPLPPPTMTKEQASAILRARRKPVIRSGPPKTGIVRKAVEDFLDQLLLALKTPGHGELKAELIELLPCFAPPETIAEKEPNLSGLSRKKIKITDNANKAAYLAEQISGKRIPIPEEGAPIYQSLAVVSSAEVEKLFAAYQLTVNDLTLTATFRSSYQRLLFRTIVRYANPITLSRYFKLTPEERTELRYKYGREDWTKAKAVLKILACDVELPHPSLTVGARKKILEVAERNGRMTR